MPSTARLVRRKRRLTKRLTERDNAALAAGRDVPTAKWLRARIYRVDLLLERKGLL